jgi:CubicO group peptidase (beta-lactamase class C family)
MTTRWHKPALDYIPRWLDYQIKLNKQPGCCVAVAYRGRLLFDMAFGLANAGGKTPLSSQHGFRVASHSKSFTASGVLRLRELGKLRLDDPIGRYVNDLHPEVAEVTLAQLLSHSAGLVRDGDNCGQWVDRRPFLNEQEMLKDLSGGPTIPPNTRFKYSNHGYGLIGVAIESIVGESWASWIQRNIVEAAGLKHTFPDMPGNTAGTPMPLASGHTRELSDGKRRIIPGDNPTHALAPATGFVSTAGDLARFFAQLAPNAKRSILSPASRRELIRRQWTDTCSSEPRDYGLGIISGKVADWPFFGHSGGFQGFITRTACLPEQELTLSVLTNAADGMAGLWLDGIINILQAFASNGPPTRKVAGWGGRWCGLWGTIDLVPVGNRVLATSPEQTSPMQDATEIEVVSRDHGRIVAVSGFGSYGEEVCQVRSAKGTVTDVYFAGMRMTSQRKLERELHKRYRER